MVGVAHAGITDAQLGFDLAGDINTPGNVTNQLLNGHDPFPFGNASGAITADGGSTAVKPAATARAGADEAGSTTFSKDWFDTVHILPRTKIEFGNILGLEEVEYEIFNAYRNSAITITAINNSVSPGVDLPDIDVSDATGKLSSFLDPSSTDNTAGTGLGTLVKLKVQALLDGLPTFDGSVVFEFDSGDDVFLEFSGSRIVLIPMEYEAPVGEALEFLTDIITSINGKEQRIALRKNPRQVFDITYILDGADRQRMQSLLMDWTANVFGFPLWHEQVRLTAAVSAGTTTYQVTGADDVDFREGGLALIITDNNTFDVINITALTDTEITANDPSTNAYPAGTLLMPLRAARIIGSVQGTLRANNIEEFRVRFEVTDNNTGALTGDVSAYSTYDGKVLFDDCNVMDESISTEYARRIYRIDNSTGKVDVSSSWTKNKKSSIKGFSLRNRGQIKAFRKMLAEIRGRQRSFWLPTFIEDLNVKANLTVGGSTLDIDFIGYTRFVQSRSPKNVFKITFTDGTSLVRTVESAIAVDSSTERLTVNTTWPANRTVSEIRRVQFYELMRFDADSIPIQYPRIGLGNCRLPVTQVFDDD